LTVAEYIEYNYETCDDLTPRSRVLPVLTQPPKKPTAFCGTRRFINREEHVILK